MAVKEFICAYKYCLHHGQTVSSAESVVINRKHYHWDCAAIKNEIKDCADAYINYVEDKALYPVACRIINNLVFKYKIPIEFIKKNIDLSKEFYSKKPVQVLYGMRKLFWEKNK